MSKDQTLKESILGILLLTVHLYATKSGNHAHTEKRKALEVTVGICHIAQHEMPWWRGTGGAPATPLPTADYGLGQHKAQDPVQTFLVLWWYWEKLPLGSRGAVHLPLSHGRGILYLPAQ